MKKKKNAVYECALWGCDNLSTTLHEIIFGSLYRQLCIDYSIQAPLCPECHNKAHGRGIALQSQQGHIQKKIKKYLVETFLKQNYNVIVRAFSTPVDHGYLETIERACRKRIEGSEI